MELRVGAGLAFMGIAVAIGQWLVRPEGLSYEIRFILVSVALFMFFSGIFLTAHAGWSHYFKVRPDEARKTAIRNALIKFQMELQPIQQQCWRNETNALVTFADWNQRFMDYFRINGEDRISVGSDEQGGIPLIPRKNSLHPALVNLDGLIHMKQYRIREFINEYGIKK